MQTNWQKFHCELVQKQSAAAARAKGLRAEQRGDEAAFCADPLAKPLPYLSPRAVPFYCLSSLSLFVPLREFSLFREAIVARFLAQVNGRKIVA